ncbi:MAG: BTAD domain-containing putative transcriptional regulator, partial [Gemmatimonadota bacterium]
PKRLAILAYLCLADPGSFIRRDTLIALFWPESDEGHARAALNQSLYVLRSALGSQAVIGRGREDVGIDRSLLVCDACAFRDALESDDLQSAIDLYAGELLPGLHIDSPDFERWLASERAGLREAALAAALELGARAAAAGEVAEATEFYRRALEIAPESALAARHLVEALWHAGRRPAAIEAYDRFAANLVSEYGVEPGSELQELIARVRAGDRSPGTVSTADPPPGQASTVSGPENEDGRAADETSSTARFAWMRVGIPFGLGAAVIVLLGMWFGQSEGRESRAAFEANLDYERAWAAWESQGVDSAHFYLERAVRADSTHARAWALLGYVDLLLATSKGEPAGEAIPAARRAAERAIALDSTLPAAWHTHATTVWATLDWEGAAREYRRTLDLPSRGTWEVLSRVDLSALLADLGRCEEAWEVIEPYAVLEPMDQALGPGSAIRIPYLCGDHDRAVELAEQALAAGDSSPSVLNYLFLATLEGGDLAGATDALDRLSEMFPGHPYLEVPEVLLLARSGDLAGAGEIVDEISARDPAEIFAGFYRSTAEPRAQLNAAVGELDGAFEILEAEMDSTGHVRRLSSHPLFEPLRDDPRFEPLVARMGLRCRRADGRQSCQPIE